MKTIVALVDFSDLTFKVLKQAHTLAKAFDREVIILHTIPNDATLVDTEMIDPFTTQDPSPKVVRKHYSQLLEMRDSIIKWGVRATVRQLNGADVMDALAEARKLKADIIILGSHHHSAFYNMLVGSVTSEVLKRAPCPVLVVPSDNDAHEKK